MANPYTISIADISHALGVSRTTLWRLLKGQEMAYFRSNGVKLFMAADVITRIRQHTSHSPATETTLLNIDKQRRQNRKHEAQQNDV